LYVPRSIVWNEEEVQKSYLFGDLKPIRIAIDFGRRICQNRVHISRNQQYIPTRGQTNSMWQKAPRARHQYGRVSVALAAFLRPYGGAALRDSTCDPVTPLWCPILPINTLGFSELRRRV